jgi:hypothetical protein
LVAAVLPLAIFLLSQVRPVYVVRAFLTSALAYFPLAAGVLSARTVPRPIRWGVLLLSIGIAAGSLVNHYTYARFPRPPFDQVAANLRGRWQPGDALVHSNKIFPPRFCEAFECLRIAGPLPFQQEVGWPPQTAAEVRIVGTSIGYKQHSDGRPDHKNNQPLPDLTARRASQTAVGQSHGSLS